MIVLYLLLTFCHQLLFVFCGENVCEITTVERKRTQSTQDKRDDIEERKSNELNTTSESMSLQVVKQKVFGLQVVLGQTILNLNMAFIC